MGQALEYRKKLVPMLLEENSFRLRRAVVIDERENEQNVKCSDIYRQYEGKPEMSNASTNQASKGHPNHPRILIYGACSAVSEGTTGN